jgi:hypothetical protein
MSLRESARGNSAGGTDEGPFVLSDNMLADLVQIGRLTEQDIEVIATQFGLQPGMLTVERIVEIVNDVAGEEIAVPLARAICNIRPEQKGAVLQAMLDSVADDSQTQAEPEPSVLAGLRNLDKVIQNYPALRLMHQATVVVRESGNQLDDVHFTCDLRAIYDDTYSSVQALVSLVSLRLRFLRQDGSLGVCELTLTEGELHGLIEAANAALKRLQLLRSIGT